MECEYDKRKKCDSLYIERYNKLLKENEELKRTLKEVRERVNSLQILYGMKPLQVFKDDLLEILDKGE